MASKQVVLITGANTGLGLEVVKALYKSSSAYEIVLGCRSTSKGEEAATSVQQETSNSASAIAIQQIDIASDDSIQKAVDATSSKYGKLDVLINNAGGNFDVHIGGGGMSVREAWNESWNINVAGTQVATERFMPLLLKSSNPRLMFVTSGTSTMAETERMDNAALARINASPPAGWPKDAGINPIAAYRSSKAGLNMMMREWTRLLKKDGVKVWAISPGFLATGLAGIGGEKLKQMGALDPSEGGKFIRDVVEGKRDQDAGKVIRVTMIQPW